MLMRELIVDERVDEREVEQDSNRLKKRETLA